MQLLISSDGQNNSGDAKWSASFSHGVAAAGTATIPSQATFVTLIGGSSALPAGLDGLPVNATLNTSGAGPTTVLTAAWDGSDNLTIVCDAASDGSAVVSFAVFAAL